MCFHVCFFHVSSGTNSPSLLKGQDFIFSQLHLPRLQSAWVIIPSYTSLASLPFHRLAVEGRPTVGWEAGIYDGGRRWEEASAAPLLDSRHIWWQKAAKPTAGRLMDEVSVVPTERDVEERRVKNGRDKVAAAIISGGYSWWIWLLGVFMWRIRMLRRKFYWRRHRSRQLPLIRYEFGTLNADLVFFKSVLMRIKAPIKHAGWTNVANV